GQTQRPRLVALDTMNYWISSKLESLKRIVAAADLLVINEAEVRAMTGEVNLIKAAAEIHAMGPKTVVLKRGEYGVLMITPDAVFAAPAYPLESVFDPTGAGDTFAGGFLGYLASCEEFDDRAVRRAIIHGSVLASFNVESFSLDRLRSLTRPEIDQRYRSFSELTRFEELAAE
ncbi:MAG: PfkB family carbohydrate kinase, partial [Acidobacteriota bacterium]